MMWASQQKPSVNQLWQECWKADPYGSRWMPLTSAIRYSTFISAKKILSDSGLFIFKPDKSIQDDRETVKWMVKNLHGSRMKEFWEKANCEKRELNAGDSDKDAGSEEMRALNQASILVQNQSEQGFQEPSRTGQKLLTNSSKEIVRSVSDTLTGNSREEKTAHAPLRGASPQTVQGVSEKEEELPAVTDCTSLALVEAARSNPASLLAENQNCGVEPRDCHEGTCSAAPIAVNEFSSTLAIANQTQEEVEQNNSASQRDAARTLSGENQVSGFEPKDCDEEPSSAAPVLLNQSEIFEWLDRANLGKCPPLWVIQYLLDSKYYTSMRASISKFEKQWNISVVNYQVQKSSDTIS
ncbi:MAG: hypothetical protein V7L22_29560 [Nostoc sp.]|uniref:hypothetical protein n=1 Tax=Nostoc sp. TaxID=1180 RepID=UPI002FFB7664